MPRNFYEATLGIPDVDTGFFQVLDGLRITVYLRNTTNAAAIYQRETGVTQGPSPEAGATGGPNPFTTGASGAVQFWCDIGRYDIKIEDLEVPARLSTRTIQWNSIPLDGIPVANLDVDVLALFVPIGALVPYGGASDPSGGRFMLADSRLIDRTTYAAYFTAVGHMYNGGVDPGSNRVRIADGRGRVIVGADNMGTATGAAGRITVGNRARGQNGGVERVAIIGNEMPLHKHYVSDANYTVPLADTAWMQSAPAGGFTGGNTLLVPLTPGQTGYADRTDSRMLEAGNQVITGGQSHQNLQPYEVDNMIVRVA